MSTIALITGGNRGLGYATARQLAQQGRRGHRPHDVRAHLRHNVIGAVAVFDAFLPLLRHSVAGRIVNVSSTMGSLTDQLDPTSPYYTTVLPAYQSSKAALNGITIALSKQLSATPIKVTSVCPGFVQTDLTPISRAQAPLTAQEAAGVIVTAATLHADGPSGTFIDRDGAVSW